MKNKIIRLLKYGIVFVGVFIAQTIMNTLLTSTFEENEAAGFGIGFGLIFGALLLMFLFFLYIFKQIYLTVSGIEDRLGIASVDLGLSRSCLEDTCDHLRTLQTQLDCLTEEVQRLRQNPKGKR